MQQVSGPHDPAPSRWAYKFQRLLLTPLFWLMLRVVVPFTIVAVVTWVWLSDEARREKLMLLVNDVRTQIATRPEFLVSAVAIDGASDEVAANVREILSLKFPASSFDLDLEAIQRRVVALSAVKTASVRVRPGGILQLNIVEREPILMWRTHQGLFLIDRDGVVTSAVKARAARSELPLIAGKGASDHVNEALHIYASAGPLADRMRGLVWVGERRWDVVLDRDQRILLPEQGAVQALERVIALSEAQAMLERNLLIVDMRLSARPTIRMAQHAVEEWWQISQISMGNGQQ